jgi:DNA-binding protein H-NS
MTATYKELLEQLKALEIQAEEARKRELKDAVGQVRNLIDQYGLTAEDVFPTSRKKGAAAGSTVAPKYRDPATGATWTGRGKPPKWIAGQNKEQFAIPA